MPPFKWGYFLLSALSTSAAAVAVILIPTWEWMVFIGIFGLSLYVGFIYIMETDQ